MEPMNIVNPYVITELHTKISLKPEQINNKIYINLRSNLVNKLLGKCYGNYGYIDEIYKLEYGDGRIDAENFSGSIVYDIKFSCKLCRVVEDTNIVCKIERVNRALTIGTHGSILVIIVNDKMNPNVFFTDHNNMPRYKDQSSSKKLEPGDYVVIRVLNKEFFDKDDKIKVLGYLEKMANEDEIENYSEIKNTI